MRRQATPSGIRCCPAPHLADQLEGCARRATGRGDAVFGPRRRHRPAQALHRYTAGKRTQSRPRCRRRRDNASSCCQLSFSTHCCIDLSATGQECTTPRSGSACAACSARGAIVRTATTCGSATCHAPLAHQRDGRTTPRLARRPRPACVPPCLSRPRAGQQRGALRSPGDRGTSVYNLMSWSWVKSGAHVQSNDWGQADLYQRDCLHTAS